MQEFVKDHGDCSMEFGCITTCRGMVGIGCVTRGRAILMANASNGVDFSNYSRIAFLA
jgi:hypothetical protein